MTAPSSITVTSRAFQDGGKIPKKYSCDGDDVSPPLAWKGLPTNLGAVALVVDDPDAPRGTFTHWVLLDLDPTTTSIAEGQVPTGAKQANNSAGRASYFGPCPPSGTHHYRFTVYALSEATGLPDGAKLDDALTAIDSRTLARGRLTGLYKR
ncbi:MULTISPECIES: YbhB/YbcL family Raf kinase inhibitor-like protein [unclassified Kribbella]|uniref:YbhB/YbcL family Raf kinase inhibitor-like protein n=1 Tax=unclassified Kribbella TaxID=2644121 RepID=UPI0030785954